MRLFRPPTVYRPQADTWLLVEALRLAAIPAGGRALDIGCGTGALSVAAAMNGSAEVTAFDINRSAVVATRINAAARRLPVRVTHGDGLTLALGRRFDLVLANPPYVPTASDTTPPRGRARSWDAGLDGRAVLDRLCALAPLLLAPGGTLLTVHSHLCGPDTTLRLLRGGGLKAAIIERREVPFGPVLRARAELLARRGLIEPDQQLEELVVIRADLPEQTTP
jgi:release factor glutamine methyltransferase